MKTVTALITYRCALNVPDDAGSDKLAQIIDRTSVFQPPQDNGDMIGKAIERFCIISDTLQNDDPEDMITASKEKLKINLLSLSNRQENEKSELVQMLKNYLDTKYRKHVRFNQNNDDELNEIMEMSGFYLPQLSISDKNGYSICREVFEIELEDDKIDIYLLEENPIKDAAQNLSFERLFYLADAIVKYEEAYRGALEEMAEDGSWRERAEEMLSFLYPQYAHLIADFVLERWQNLRDDGINIMEFEEYIKENG